LEWVRNFLIALAATLALWVALFGFEQLVQRLNYFQRFPFYVCLALLTYYLGTEGYRNAKHRYPQWTELAIQGEQIAITNKVAAHESQPVPAPEAAADTDITPNSAVPAFSASPATTRDWRLQAQTWQAKIEAQRWWQDPDLTLVKLARKLGTNTSDLSRAINEGLGLNFNELINRLRVDAVKAALLTAQPNPAEAGLLDIAFAAGFSSKASFNRSFKLYTGQTPSQYRTQAGLKS
jgi:AraC-like DNA-binding protein